MSIGDKYKNKYESKIRTALSLLTLTCFCFLTSLSESWSQNICSFDDYQKELIRDNSKLEERLKVSEENYISYFSTDGPTSSRATYTLPVVFHVIHNGGLENLSGNRILQSLEWVNKSLANEIPYGNPEGANVDVELCIANQDPQGNLTNGINRIASDLTDFDMLIQDGNLKSLIQWDSRKYINVWIVKEVRKGTETGVAGYATLPGSHGSSTDGIVMEAAFVGEEISSNGVFSHEVGHYLGLYHTFQGGCLNDDCVAQGDRVCDTPPDQTNIPVPCETTLNSCDTDTNSGFATDQNDKNNNFMDYNTLSCTNQFTPGQAERMRYFVTNDRSSLLSSFGCLAPCEDLISLDIIASSLNPQPNEPVIITNNSINASNYEWYLGSSLESTLAEPTFTFTSPGIYEIVVHAFGAEANCFAFDTLSFEVQCAAIASFSPFISDCIEFDAIPTLTYDGVAGTDIEWYIDGNLVSTASSLNPTFSAGPNLVELLASNEFCTSSYSQYIFVSCNEICDNGFDDDGDGLIDCFDTDCCDVCDDFYYEACVLEDSCFNYPPFSIQLKWEGTEDIHSGLQPAVGDLDQDGEVEILAVGLSNFFGRFKSFDGEGNFNGNLGPFSELNFRSAPTIGDVDGDGLSEILYINSFEQVVCLDHNGSVKYRSAAGLMPGCCLKLGAMLQLSDLNYDGNPEIIMGNKVLNGQTGALLVDGSLIGASEGQFSSGSVINVNGVTVANILPDDDPAYPRGLEIITGNQILSVDLDANIIKIEVEMPGVGDNYGVAIDYDQDGDLDVYTVSNSSVIVWEGQTPDILYSVNLPEKVVSFPVIANLDDDPELESVVGTRVISFQPKKLIALEEDLTTKWVANIEEFSSSSPIGFDFNLDGKNEIVHRSDDNLRILNGENGQEIFVEPCGAGTNFEHPIIADIDGDGHAELLIGCAEESEYRARLRAYEGVEEWPMTRSIASHYGLINTQINDDLSIPQFAQEYHLQALRPGIHTYLTAYAYTEEPGPIDVSVVNFNFEIDCDSLNQITFTYDIINNAPFTIDYIYMESIYSGNPEMLGSSLLINNSPNISVSIPALDTITRSLTISTAGIDLNESHQWCLLVNDDGQSALPIDWETDFPLAIQRECNYDDNLACIDYEPDSMVMDLLPDVISLCGAPQLVLKIDGEWSTIIWNDNSTADSLVVNTPGQYWVTVKNENCVVITDSILVTTGDDIVELMLPDTLYRCNENIINIEAPSGYQTYYWHDGSDLPTYSAFSDGMHILTVTDYCNRTFTDSTFIVSLPLELELPDTISVCANFGDSIVILEFFDNVDIFPNVPNGCTDCNEIHLPTDISRHYQIIAYTNDGCIALDSIFVSSLILEDQIDSVYFCLGDSIVFNNQLITDATEVVEDLICDKTYTTRFIPYDFNVTFELKRPCQSNDDGQIIITAVGAGPFSYLIDDMIMESDTVQNLVADSYNLKVVDNNGCVIENDILLESFVPPNIVEETHERCVGDSIFINDIWIYQSQEIEITSLDCDTFYNITVVFYESPELVITSQSPCYGMDNGAISLEALGSMPFDIRWDSITSDTSYLSHLASGIYRVTVTDGNLCSAAAEVILTSLAAPVGSINSKYIIEGGSSIQLSVADVDNATSILWTPSDGLSCDDCLDPIASPTSDQSYIIDIVDENGCTLQLQTRIVVKNTDYFMPNIFSPNGDNINDILALISEDSYIYDLQVFDRWGGIVFNGKQLITTDKQSGWDGTYFGKQLTTGVYVYVVKVYSENETDIFAGNITLTY